MRAGRLSGVRERDNLKEKTLFFCSDCGFESTRWYGKCPSCGKWNTFVEATTVTGSPSKQPASAMQVSGGYDGKVMKLSEVSSTDEIRFSTGLGELDRVLGGGAVQGSLVLVGGEPGVGKSTLLLQICSSLCERQRVLYVSGEESLRQISMRAKRLGVASDNLSLMSETNLDKALDAARTEQPDILIIDSIQTMFRTTNASAPGSVSQIKECTLALMQLAKNEGVTIFVVGHVNKEGSLAGPKVLEHIVDCVLSFEGDRNLIHRILRAEKNRFGSTNEIGVFEMAGDGLREIPNPSEMLLSGRPQGVAGSCVACVMEGSRPVLAEVQALVVPTAYGNPRRMSSGLDYNRAVLMLAVLERRAGLITSNRDAYINVVGGLRVDEPAVDLATILALAGAMLDRPTGDDLAAFGEVGLAGELRAVAATEQRLAEVHRLGFKRCAIPSRGARGVRIPDGLEVVRVGSVKEAIQELL